MAASFPFFPLPIMSCDPKNKRPKFCLALDERYECICCNTVLYDGFQLSCGHHICKNCITTVFKDGREGYCKVKDCNHLCKREEIFPDACLRREISLLKVYCDFDGCNKILSWKELEEHKSTCEFKMCICNFCSKTICEKYKQQHTQEECEFRSVTCDHCNETSLAKDMQNHISNICPNVILECPNDCGSQKLTRAQFADHVKMCPRRKYPCKYKDVGCMFEGLANNSHDVECSSLHLELIANQDQVDLQNTKTHTWEIQATIESLQQQIGEISKIHRENEGLRKEIQTSKKSIQDLKILLATYGEKTINIGRHLEDKATKEDLKKLKDDANKIKETIQAVKERVQILENSGANVKSHGGATSKSVEPLERNVGLVDVKLHEIDVRMQLMETINFEGVLMWKIRDYTRRKREAISGRTLSLYSQPFYTSQYGYKLCCRVYLNGDGAGKGLFLSFFIVVMRGDFDALLPWPFAAPITLMVIDQNSTFQHVSQSFKPSQSNDSFQRPRMEMNVSCGIPRFISHKNLETETYLKEDTIFLKAVVDCKAIPVLY